MRVRAAGAHRGALRISAGIQRRRLERVIQKAQWHVRYYGRAIRSADAAQNRFWRKRRPTLPTLVVRHRTTGFFRRGRREIARRLRARDCFNQWRGARGVLHAASGQRGNRAFFFPAAGKPRNRRLGALPSRAARGSPVPAGRFLLH